MTANAAIRRTIERVSAALVKSARKFPASILADVGGRRGTLGGRINWPVSLAGTPVNPGDLIVGDADGVVVVPREMAAEIIGAAQAKLDSEAERMKAISRSELVQGWVAEGLKSAGVLGKNEKL
jgi:hypothetical protein